MRELILKVWCDVCALERLGDHMEAQHTYTVGAVSGESRPALKVLELCDTHNKLATDLMELLAQVGQTLAAKPARQAPPPEERQPTNAQRLVACPACRLEVARNAMVAHVWRHHRSDSRPDHHLICPTCREVTSSPAGLAAHRRNVHGFDAVADALSGVDEARYPALASWRKSGGQL
jgi:hypothetical protein